MHVDRVLLPVQLYAADTACLTRCPDRTSNGRPQIRVQSQLRILLLSCSRGVCMLEGVGSSGCDEAQSIFRRYRFTSVFRDGITVPTFRTERTRVSLRSRRSVPFTLNSLTYAGSHLSHRISSALISLLTHCYGSG